MELSVEGVVLNERSLAESPMLGYACLVVSLILRRPVGREELVNRLRRRMRQHSIGRQSRGAYVLSHLHQHPP
jgi:hypothetical protein